MTQEEYEEITASIFKELDFYILEHDVRIVLKAYIDRTLKEHIK